LCALGETWRKLASPNGCTHHLHPSSAPTVTQRLHPSPPSTTPLCFSRPLEVRFTHLQVVAWPLPLGNCRSKRRRLSCTPALWEYAHRALLREELEAVADPFRATCRRPCGVQRKERAWRAGGLPACEDQPSHAALDYIVFNRAV